MKYTLVVPEVVYEEINEALLYYESKQLGLGNKLLLDWEEASGLISNNPLSFQKTRKDYRHILLTKFPYIIIYRIYDNKVVVYKFINAKRHPSKRHK